MRPDSETSSISHRKGSQLEPGGLASAPETCCEAIASQGSLAGLWEHELLMGGGPPAGGLSTRSHWPLPQRDLMSHVGTRAGPESQEAYSAL